jgi:hypothetical protein
MLKDIILLAIGAIFGLGATMAGAAAPSHFPSTPSWVWYWLFWGGIALMGLMLIDGLWLLVQRPSLKSAGLINIGLLFLAAGIISVFDEKDKHQEQAAKISSDLLRPLDRKVIVNCESYVQRPLKLREDKKLYTTQIINPGSQRPVPSATNTYFMPGFGDIKWDESAPSMFARCDIVNYSRENLFRVSFDMRIHWQKVIKTENQMKNGETIALEVVRSAEFDLSAQGTSSDFFYIHNNSEYHVFIEKPSVATVFTGDSDEPKTVTLIPSS